MLHRRGPHRRASARTTAVRGVSPARDAGRITGVLGANGAGKTHHPARHPRPGPARLSGRIVLDGQDVTGLTTPAAGPRRHRAVPGEPAAVPRA